MHRRLRPPKQRGFNIIADNRVSLAAPCVLRTCSRNVFLKNGQAKVGDFGLSKRIETTSEDQANVLDGKANDGKSCWHRF